MDIERIKQLTCRFLLPARPTTTQCDVASYWLPTAVPSDGWGARGRIIPTAVQSAGHYSHARYVGTRRHLAACQLAASRSRDTGTESVTTATLDSDGGDHHRTYLCRCGSARTPARRPVPLTMTPEGTRLTRTVTLSD